MLRMQLPGHEESSTDYGASAVLDRAISRKPARIARARQIGS